MYTRKLEVVNEEVGSCLILYNLQQETSFPSSFVGRWCSMHLTSPALGSLGVPPRHPYIRANTVTPPEIEHKTITNTQKNCSVLRKHYLWTIYNICHDIFTCMRRSFCGSHSHILAPIFFQFTTEQGGHLKREQNHQVAFIILLKSIIC